MTRPSNPEMAEKIRTEAAKLIFEKGLAAVSARTIAKNLGITATTIYYYYKDMNEIYKAIKIDGFIGLDSFIQEKQLITDSAANQLASIMESFIIWCKKNSNLAELMFEKLPAQFDLTDEEMQIYYLSYSRVVNVLEFGKLKGEFKFDDVDEAASIGFAMIYGIIVLDLNKRFHEKYWDDISILIRRAKELLLNYLKVN